MNLARAARAHAFDRVRSVSSCLRAPLRLTFSGMFQLDYLTEECIGGPHDDCNGTSFGTRISRFSGSGGSEIMYQRVLSVFSLDLLLEPFLGIA